MKKSGFGIASLILGIAGLCLACVVIGILPAVLGVIFGIIALLQKDRKHGLAIAGLICSGIALLFSVIMIIVAVGFGGSSEARKTGSADVRQSSVEADSPKDEEADKETAVGESAETAVGESAETADEVTWVTWMENGNSYKGVLKDGLIEGEGECLYENGNRYEGQFSAGKKDGIGTYYFASGDYYEGEFKEDKIDGLGIYYHANGDRYEGQFSAGKKDGIGTYYFASGDYYKGEFKEDKLDGIGTLYHVNGDFEETEYSAGELVDSTYYKASGGTGESDEVEMGENMLIATVNGEKMVFYLERANSASDGYESSYVSFTDEGEPLYNIYLRIPLSAKAGSYSNSNGKACYFSVSTSYNAETGGWGDSYRMVHYDSIVQSNDIGTYSLVLDHDLDWDIAEGSGTFEAELVGYSGATEGKTMSVTGGSFHYTKGEVHSVVLAWQDGSMNSDSGTWIDPYSGTEKAEKVPCTKCGGTGKVICSYCDGAGTLVHRKSSVDLGSGSTGYTVTVKCACDNGYYKCSRCGGTGYTN